MSRNEGRAVVSEGQSQKNPCAAKRRLPAAPDTPSSPYAPGAIRCTTDEEHSRLCNFCTAHPEFADRLGYEGLKQVAATYLDDGDMAVRSELRAAGVSGDWRRGVRDDETGGLRLAEECS